MSATSLLELPPGQESGGIFPGSEADNLIADAIAVLLDGGDQNEWLDRALAFIGKRGAEMEDGE